MEIHLFNPNRLWRRVLNSWAITSCEMLEIRTDHADLAGEQTGQLSAKGSWKVQRISHFGCLGAGSNHAEISAEKNVSLMLAPWLKSGDSTVPVRRGILSGKFENCG
jgi:hypothetical protein